MKIFDIVILFKRIEDSEIEYQIDKLNSHFNNNNWHNDVKWIS